ncbi:hypothetical protein AB0P12_32025 [Streptomyces subrutilus]|uniref:Uncharacterized protein n=1 Tax=Streptomyces subrutilus TaxID=36818 RepID=A0A5P2UK57_9ACTN|nr:hypothetical protein [Streptomyces subrutilus]QEU79686.1 hypothetical protein CP968_16315 [Streptomyces subrutilus]WSJ31067.1 hypothetical protein OG479_18285 [Streptomyces subrutilus]GGZ95810.1 hypothetical protein GCM10010371_64800 [Streptomyces subrutilus]
MTSPTPEAASRAALAVLRGALAVHGIVLPSLDLHLMSYAGSCGTPPLIALGNCNPATALRLAEALAPGAAG